MINGSLKEIALTLGLNVPDQNAFFKGISIDTRTLMPNNLFIAIKGEQFDGHQFLGKALEKKASAAILDHALENPIPQLVVKNTIKALGKITQHWRNQFNIPIVGITGSNGKTTLKNMVASILCVACQHNENAVLATQGNLNNNIGVPLNLALLNATHRYGVLEMGMNHFGEIAYLTQLVQPTVAVINNAASAHLAGVGNVAGVAKAKGEIFLGLKENGIAILNQDDAFFNYWKNLIGHKKWISFGLENKADVTAIIHNQEPILIKTPKGEFSVTLPLLGKHNIMNALAATAATLALNINLTAIKIGLENVKAAAGRMHLYHLENNIKIIDDTYNANPFSLEAAIQTLATYADKKILVLGDMKELGKDEEKLHEIMGQKIKNAGIDYLFTLGKLTKLAANSFGKNAYHFNQEEELIKALKPLLIQNTTILVKGSRSMQMEKIVEHLVPEAQLEHLH